VDYIERRWERFYVQYPPFLNMMGDVAFRLNKLDYALTHYWLYVNLMPSGEEADIILTRIGDIYGMQREKNAARELYTECLERFPDKDGGLVAMMRLAEEGVNDNPTIAGMFSIFDGPANFAPVDAYRRIINEHPDSSLVPLADIKLALWHLWKKDYITTLDTLSAFIGKYPKHELAPRAREIAMQTFAVLATESMQTERYGKLRDIWERYPIVRNQGEVLTPESRLALGVGYRYEGKPNEALQIVEPFFLGNKIPEYSEMALSLVLNLYLEYDQWQSIREVSRRVELWELSPESRLRLDYALALAAENLNDGEEARKLWQKLYDSNQLSPAEMTYAAFFLARHAEKDRELEKAYFVGKEALNRLLQQVETNPNAADVGKIQTQLASLMDVAETAGRLREALNFADQYLQYIPAEDPERNAVQYRISRIYKKQGDMEGWKKNLTAIMSQAPNSVYGQLAASELNSSSIAEDAAQYSPTGSL
jgi:tetratricopeptide (TPR) repeat protein